MKEAAWEQAIADYCISGWHAEYWQLQEIAFSQARTTCSSFLLLFLLLLLLFLFEEEVLLVPYACWKLRALFSIVSRCSELAVEAGCWHALATAQAGGVTEHVWDKMPC